MAHHSHVGLLSWVSQAGGYLMDQTMPQPGDSMGCSSAVRVLAQGSLGPQVLVTAIQGWLTTRQDRSALPKLCPCSSFPRLLARKTVTPLYLLCI